MSVYLSAFLLGNAAILTNVCVLPLYPGLIAFLAGSRLPPPVETPPPGRGRLGRGQGSGGRLPPPVEGGSGGRQNGRTLGGGVLLGAAVLAGVLATMIALGFIVYALGQSFSRILPWLLPLIYGVVLALGVAMLLGHNPFARLTTAHAPLLGNPYAAAFLYGGMLAPMTLPCTGPVVIGAFVLGVGSAAALGHSLLYFFAFGLGFGWPLLALPLIAAPLQRGITSRLAGSSQLLGRLSGALLVAIALFGIWVDLVPAVMGDG